MSFNTTFELTNGVAKIAISGDLDASSASIFKEEVEKAAVPDLKRLVLLVSGLEYMASAGLRVLIFAKQKMGSGVDIYFVGAQEAVLDTIQKTGFNHSVIIQDEYTE